MSRRMSVLLVVGCVAASATGVRTAPAPAPKALIDQYCLGCHSQRLHTGGLDLESLSAGAPGANAETWEKVIARLRAGSMPPPGRPRPDKATYHAAAVALEEEIDRAWAAHPEPGRIGAVHRLNRVEYSNAMRDLFGIDPLSLDVKSLLPGDETADGSFDNFADSLSISTAHLERYLSVARQVTRHRHGPAAGEPRHRALRDPAVRHPGRSPERGPAARIPRRHRHPAQLPGRRRVPRSRSGCSGSIRTTSKAWGGRSGSTCGSTASC